MIDIIVSSEMLSVAGSLLQIKIPTPQQRVYLAYLLQQTSGKKVNVRIGRWYPKRSTGRYSQCNHFHGHCQQIADHTGHTLGEIKQFIKDECNAWPTERIGKRFVKISESKLNSKEEAEAIEVTHRIAAEFDIPLIEGEFEDPRSTYQSVSGERS